MTSNFRLAADIYISRTSCLYWQNIKTLIKLYLKMISKSYCFWSIIECNCRFHILQNSLGIQLNINKRNVTLQSHNSSKGIAYEKCKGNNIIQLIHSCQDSIFRDRMVDVNVCIIGGGLSSVYTAALLKQSHFVKDIHLIDPNERLAGTILDACHIDTSIHIKYFPKKLIRAALVEANIIALMDEGDCNTHKDPYVQLNRSIKYIHEMTKHMITVCPTALVTIFTKPVTSTLSMISEIYKHAGKWDPNRLIGSVSTDIMRIEAITGNILDLNPASVSIPIVGGADLNTIVPLLSCAKPINQFTAEQSNALIELFQAAEQDAVHSNVKQLALLDGSAAVKLILAVVRGLSGLDNVYECAFVRSNVLPSCHFFTSQLQFGLGGVKENFGLPKVSPAEVSMVEQAIPIINEYVQMGVKAASCKKIKS